jgi:hypothetical protein
LITAGRPVSAEEILGRAPHLLQRSGSEETRAECEQLSPHCFPRGLQVDRTRRTCDRPDVVRSYQVGDWPEDRHDERNCGERTRTHHYCAMAAPQSGKSRHHGTTVRLAEG